MVPSMSTTAVVVGSICSAIAMSSPTKANALSLLKDPTSAMTPRSSGSTIVYALLVSPVIGSVTTRLSKARDSSIT